MEGMKLLSSGDKGRVIMSEVARGEAGASFAQNVLLPGGEGSSSLSCYFFKKQNILLFCHPFMKKRLNGTIIEL